MASDDRSELTRGQTARRTERGRAKEERIVDAAMRHFARAGYHAARVEDIAADLSIAKGSVFQYFGSKEALFLAAYRRAVRSFARYLDAPPEIVAGGFFPTLRYWLERTEGLLRDNWVPYRLALIGNYASDIDLRREISRFLAREDPYGTMPFIRMGIARGEVRSDVEPELLGSILEWTFERFQDALLSEELDPGLFRRGGPPERTRGRIDEFVTVLESALAPPPRGRRSA
jgi:AcrR family transcriptional regulator